MCFVFHCLFRTLSELRDHRVKISCAWTMTLSFCW